MSRKNKAITVLIALVLISTSFFVGMNIDKHDSENNSHSTNAAANFENYPFLARRIFVENPNEPIINFTSLRQTLNNYFLEQNINGSLYFEYLPTGTSIRIAGDSEEVGASLIKLPAAMDLYKAHELGTLDLDQKISLKEEWLDSDFGELYKKGVGYELTLREAAKIMLKDSDNTALKAIAAAFEGKVPITENSFTFLDADFTQNEDLSVSISARSYSSFLKCLYFSCYLNKDHSQEILSSLADTNFKDRLVAGIDKDTPVSHKIGTFAQSTQSDCGIVYLERRNYVLCVMIEGGENSETDRKIAEISRRTFEFLKQL